MKKKKLNFENKTIKSKHRDLVARYSSVYCIIYTSSPTQQQPPLRKRWPRERDWIFSASRISIHHNS